MGDLMLHAGVQVRGELVSLSASQKAMAVARGRSVSPHLFSLCVASYMIYGQGDALKTGPYPASALEHLPENRAAGLAWPASGSVSPGAISVPRCW